jgi:hypothetical protein
VNQHLKLILVGTILLVFGATLVITSFFKIYDTVVTIAPTSSVLRIQANSSSDFYFWYLFGGFPRSQQVSVVVAGSPELQGLLNSTLNYNSTMNYGQNITISIVSGNESISASVRSGGSLTYSGSVAPHTFDIPADWWAGFHVRVTNPENYPVCWIVNVILFGQVVDNTWLTVLLGGIIPTILGLILFGIASHRRNGITKKEA